MHTTSEVEGMSGKALIDWYAILRRDGVDPKMPSNVKDKRRLVELVRRCLARDGELVLAEGETVRISEWDASRGKWILRDIGALTIADVVDDIGVIDPSDVKIAKGRNLRADRSEPKASRTRSDDGVKITVRSGLVDGLSADAIVALVKERHPESKFTKRMVRLYRYRWNKEMKCASQT